MMTGGLTRLTAAIAASLVFHAAASAAVYMVLPTDTDVRAGTTTNLSVVVETESGDNVVGSGFFSFALDLAFSGSAGVAGEDVKNVSINETDFDKLLSNQLGHPDGNRYLGVAGVTWNVVPPTFGEKPGDMTWLFDFDLTVPVTAVFGDLIVITPDEGALENLAANGGFDNVAPQRFQPTTLTVVPEPSTLILVPGLFALLLPAVLKRTSAPEIDPLTIP